MKTLIFALLTAVHVIAFPFPASAQDAEGFDEDVYGSYIGFMGGSSNESSVQLQFSESLELAYNYRLKRVPVREVYRVMESGRFTGTVQSRGRILATVSGTWKESPRSIVATGKSRLSNGKRTRFSQKIRFGQGTVSVLTRTGKSALRFSGVKF